nr:MAG: DNA pilot protein [Microvirus sp.]
MDPIIGGALLGVGAEILGGFMSNEASGKSAERQMEFQRQANQKAMDFSAAQTKQQMEFAAGQTQKQMDWQERLSGAAHQREVADLRSAGLNPILSVNRSGAATPSGGAASGSAASGTSSGGAAYKAENIMQRVGSTALEAIRGAEEIKNIQATNRKIVEESDYLRSQQQLASVDYNVRLEDASLRKIQWQHELKKMGKTDEEIRQIEAQIQLTKRQTELTTSTAKSAAIEAGLDAQYRGSERLINMGQGATSAIRNLNPLSGLFGRK